jgi:hypothetical protein
VRPDGVIYGPSINMGIEIQRSKLSVPQIKGRTTKARRAGVESVWFSDGQTRPPWMWKVPSVHMNPDTSWKSVPPPRTVMVASGVVSIVAKRCDDIRESKCPLRRYGCRRWHPQFGDRFGIWVDDLAEYMPAGKVLPMLYKALSGREMVVLTPKDDKARYEQMVGHAADVPMPKRKETHQATRIDCIANAGDTRPAAAQITEILPPNLRVAHGERCPTHERALLTNVPGKTYCPLCFADLMRSRGLRGSYETGGA